jgi:hypothetical protein
MSSPQFYRISHQHTLFRRLLLVVFTIMVVGEGFGGALLLRQVRHEYNGKDNLVAIKKLTSVPPEQNLGKIFKINEKLAPSIKNNQKAIISYHFNPSSIPTTVYSGHSKLIIRVVMSNKKPLENAQVQVIRYVGTTQSAPVQKKTNGRGIVILHNTLGGLYQLRAWQQPNYSDVTPTLQFITSATPQIVLTASNFTQVDSSNLEEVLPTVLDGIGSWDTQWTKSVVSSDGIVASVPLEGVITEIASGAFNSGGGSGASSPITLEGGLANLSIECFSVGSGTISVNDGGKAPLTVSGECQNATPTTSTSTPSLPTTTSATSSTPTTTSATSSTQSTSAPPPITVTTSASTTTSTTPSNSSGGAAP